MITTRSGSLFSRPLHGLRLGSGRPSDKSLGYFQPSAKRGLSGAYFLGKAPSGCSFDQSKKTAISSSPQRGFVTQRENLFADRRALGQQTQKRTAAHNKQRQRQKAAGELFDPFEKTNGDKARCGAQN